jgi:hypothetical protein
METHDVRTNVSQYVCLFSDVYFKQKHASRYFEVGKQALSITSLVSSACCDHNIETLSILFLELRSLTYFKSIQ